MRVFALVLLYLASVSHGRKLHARRERARSSSYRAPSKNWRAHEDMHGKEVSHRRRLRQPSALERLAGLLLARSNVEAGFQIVKGGQQLSRATSQTAQKNGRRQAAQGPAMFEFTDDKKELENQLEKWRKRQRGTQAYFRSIVEFQENGLQDEQDKAERRAAGETAEDEASQNAIVASAVALVVGTLVLRIGGRGALISLLGLDIVQDLGITEKIDQAILYADQAGGWAVVGFIAAWVVAKVFCIDLLSITLAFSAGVLFGGVFQGAALSVIGATLGSITAFFLSRTFLRERVEGFIEKQPVARGLARVVEKDGFKTVLVLRISPILPAVPVAAYSYIYGTTNLNPLSFASATALGSFKPYLLDSYVGVFSKQLLDGDFDSSKDIILLVGFGVLVLVGVFASQVATEAVEEVNKEIKEEDKNAKKEDSEATTESDTEEEGGPLDQISTWAWNLLPSDVQVEWEEVKVNVDKFLDDQWEPAVRAQLAKDSEERKKEREDRQERMDRALEEQNYGDFFAAYSVSRNQTKLAEIKLAANKAVEENRFLDLIDVWKSATQRDETEEEIQQRQWLADWVLEGPKPWRKVLSDLYIEFAFVGQLQNRWQGYPENMEEFRPAAASAKIQSPEQGEKVAIEGEDAAPKQLPTVSAKTTSRKPDSSRASETAETAEAIDEKIQKIQEKLKKIQEQEDSLK